MKVLVSGSRDFNDRELMEKVLNDLADEAKEMTIIHGNARGADRLAKTLAEENGWWCWPYGS